MLIIEIDESEAADAEAFVTEVPDAEIVRPRRFDGGVLVVQIVVPLVAAVLPPVIEYVRQRLSVKKRVTLIHNGVEVKDLTPETAAALIKALAASDPPPPASGAR